MITNHIEHCFISFCLFRFSLYDASVQAFGPVFCYVGCLFHADLWKYFYVFWFQALSLPFPYSRAQDRGFVCSDFIRKCRPREKAWGAGWVTRKRRAGKTGSIAEQAAPCAAPCCIAGACPQEREMPLRIFQCRREKGKELPASCCFLLAKGPPKGC